MKKKINKKMMLSVITGAMVTVAVIGVGTYAWFTSSADIAAGEFTTATVKLIASEDDSSYSVYNFLTGHALNIDYQRGLEDDADGSVLAAWLANVNPNNQLMSDEYYDEIQRIEQYEEDIAEAQTIFDAAKARWEEALAELEGLTAAIDNLVMPTIPTEPNRSDFPDGIVGALQYAAAYTQYLKDLVQYGSDMTDYYIQLATLYAQVPAAVREEREANGAQQKLEDAYNAVVAAQGELIARIAELAVFEETDPNRVTPGALIYGTYTITNESNVPTYFRLAELEDTLNGIGTIKAVAFNGTYIYTLISDGGYYYSQYALAPETEITIIIGAYILGGANTNEVQATLFAFGGTEVELIQASNNAVYLDDDWNPDTVVFVPYKDPTQP